MGKGLLIPGDLGWPHMWDFSLICLPSPVEQAAGTKPGVKPIYVSVGHKMDLTSALQWVLNCCRGYRLPEPTRLAHLAAGGMLKSEPSRQQGLFD